MINPIDPSALESATQPPDREKVKQLAQQFEALLLTQMLKEMRDSMVPEGGDEEMGFGGDVFADTMMSELGTMLSRVASVGLAGSLMPGIERMEPKDVGEAISDTETAIEPLVAPASNGINFLQQPIPLNKVSSAFGWRSDPINGDQRFHAGVDLKAAYGADVVAAGSGVVKFAGERGAYGTLVTIDHGNGYESRYAHLSSVDVTPGMRVEAGQLIARSGSSGRATGPHLHFELRHEGRAIDPSLAAGLANSADFGRNSDH